jgi:hypothetical protein
MAVQMWDGGHWLWIVSNDRYYRSRTFGFWCYSIKWLYICFLLYIQVTNVWISTWCSTHTSGLIKRKLLLSNALISGVTKLFRKKLCRNFLLILPNNLHFQRGGNKQNKKQTNSMAWAREYTILNNRRLSAPTFAERGVSRSQRGGSSMAVIPVF